MEDKIYFKADVLISENPEMGRARSLIVAAQEVLGYNWREIIENI